MNKKATNKKDTSTDKISARLRPFLHSSAIKYLELSVPAPDKDTKATRAELKRNIANIKKFLQHRDFGMIDSGIELARNLDQESIFEEFLKDCTINEGSLVGNKMFSGTGPAQPYLDYALFNLVAYAPEKTNLNKSLKRSNIKSLNLYGSTSLL